MFKVGDIVEWCGVRGIVRDIHPNDEFNVTFPLKGFDRSANFTADGRRYDWHTEPSLKLVERPKKKVTKTMYQAVYVDDNGRNFLSWDLFKSREDAIGSNYNYKVVGLGPAITFEVDE